MVVHSLGGRVVSDVANKDSDPGSTPRGNRWNQRILQVAPVVFFNLCYACIFFLFSPPKKFASIWWTR